MNIRPKQISKEILSLLNDDNTVFIHSIFNTTFNIKVEDVIININHNETILPPLGITINYEDFIRLKQDIVKLSDYKFNIKNNNLVLNDIKINVKSSEGIYSPELFTKDTLINNENIDNIIQHIYYGNYKCGFEIGCIEFISSMLDNCSDEIKNLKDFFLTNKRTGFEYFIGRGKGLTPSGDDFLLGIISILLTYSKKFENKITIIKNYIEKNKYKLTNDISESFLLNGLNRNFSNNIIKFVNSLDDKNLDENKLQNILNYGQTSGVDLVLGIVFGYVVIREGNNYE